MPNRYSQVWFQSDDIGTYDYYCAEYCGVGHSRMNGYVVVIPEFSEFYLDENNNQNIGKGRDMDDVSYFPWDLTGSGEVTEMDAVFVLNRVGANDGIADLDGNGLVNSADVMAVIDRIGYLGNRDIIEPTLNDPTQVKDMPVYLMTRTPVHDGSVQTYLLHVLDQLPSTADVEISEIMILLKANSITSIPISQHVRVQDTVFGSRTRLPGKSRVSEGRMDVMAGKLKSSGVKMG